MNICLRLKGYLNTLVEGVIWVQINMENVNEMGYCRWNAWSGLWTGGNKMKHEQRSADRKKWDEMWLMKSIM